ncbi:MAG: hypothetical protein KF774_01680 [Planctomyces sp.]|nr:hypothetical protein [Planctomyces sp.]
MTRLNVTSGVYLAPESELCDVLIAAATDPGRLNEVAAVVLCSDRRVADSLERDLWTLFLDWCCSEHNWSVKRCALSIARLPCPENFSLWGTTSTIWPVLFRSRRLAEDELAEIPSLYGERDLPRETVVRALRRFQQYGAEWRDVWPEQVVIAVES